MRTIKRGRSKRTSKANKGSRSRMRRRNRSRRLWCIGLRLFVRRDPKN